MKTLLLSMAVTVGLAFTTPVTAAQGQVSSARRSYSNCLNALVLSQVKAGADVAVFAARVQTACAAEEANLRQAIIAADLTGSKLRSENEALANDEIGATRELAVARFKDSLTPGS